MKRLLVFSMIAATVFIAAGESLYSIPAFARKYKLSCQTCHSPAPKLKKYGDEFAGNGFVLNDQDASRYFLETGDDDLSLLRELPLAIRLEGHVSYNNANEEQADFGSPWGIKLLSGGSITSGISYYLYFYMSEQGNITGLEDAFLMFNNVFGSDLDIYLGQFQVCDPLFKRELRLSLEDYEIYRKRPGLSRSGLTYDRGVMLTYGFDFGLDLAFELVNGNGLNPAEEDNFLFDSDKYKNVAGRVSQDIGEFLRIGLFGYYGQELLKNGTGSEVTNEIQVYGPDLTLSFSDIFELNLQYLMRKDKHVFLSEEHIAPENDIKTDGALAELIFTPQGDKSTWYMGGIFNWTKSDMKELDYKAAGLYGGYLLRRNIRLVCEAVYNFTEDSKKFLKVSCGIVSAF